MSPEATERQLAAALVALDQRTRELEEARAQQAATADVLKVIRRSAFDLQAALDALLSSACRLSEADIGTIRYEDGGSYRLAATYGCRPEWIKHFSGYSAKPDRSSMFGQTIIGGRTVHMPDVLADPNFKRLEAQRLMGFRAALGVPLIRETHTFGVINLFRFAARSFGARQIEIVETFADQAVIAIENVRLFQQVQSRTAELAASLDTLRAAQDRLVQTEKLASLGQLTAGIAHEIKNPLNFVNNFAALSAELVDELNDVLVAAAVDNDFRAQVAELSGLLKSNLQKVLQHGNRADSIVRNMLLHSREGSGERRPTDLNALVEESLKLAYHGARAEKPDFAITLKHDLDPDAGAIDLNPQEFTRALLNLISNGFYAAIKRSSVKNGRDFEPVLSATTRNLGEAVEVRIRDNGTGIPLEVREKMFNPFFTTKPTGEGTGLGLSITHDIIVKQHGGRIDVETEPGAFTEFIVTLPSSNGGV
ncbi:sensor histidine kinase [Bradyrhizobium guangzhouense]|uniref:sensor histidine kinase n=1 Tax=Bradyrhizobium guangzhouense TaxID=1325095 RepID=UPI0010099EC4|nr:GAF domain-containing protein [Bradyrhizobium guangzhouense]